MRDKKTREFIDDNFDPFSPENDAIISIVSVGEIYSLAAKNKWAQTKLKIVEKLLDDLIIVEVRFRDLIEMYVQIDTFSNKSSDQKELKGSAIKMGKNDLWIAATAAITQIKLLTPDNDFDHLDGAFFEVIKYSKRD